MKSGYVSMEVSPSRHSQLTVTASNNIDSSGAASNDTTGSYKHDSSLDVVDDVGNQPPPPEPLKISFYHHKINFRMNLQLQEIEFW